VGNASCDGPTRKLDAEHTDKVAADVSVALAGAFLVTSVGAFVLGAQAPARGSATIVPVLGPTTLGVAGRF
jgi:hypothetical protein